jgi:hypothetical protein
MLTPRATWLAKKLEEIATLARFLGAATPEDFDDKEAALALGADAADEDARYDDLDLADAYAEAEAACYDW